MSAAFVAAGTIISVGAAAAGTAMSVSAADKAAKAQAAAGKKMDERMGSAQQRLVEQLGQIKEPQWDVARDISDARQITKYNINQLERIFPGAKGQRQIAARATESYLRGEIPKDVQDQIMRSVAETGGAGFAPPQAGVPQAGGFQGVQGLLSRQLGLTSLGLQQTGMALSQGWQRLAGAFIESPLQVGQARLGFEKAAADIQYNKALAESGMAVDVAKGAYGTATDTIGANLATQQALASGITDTGQALGSGISGYGMEMARYGSVAGASTTPMESGFYKGQIGAANAYGVAPSSVKKYGSKGWSLA
jgi:hypothetical protein